jgi:hypothetical protein
MKFRKMKKTIALFIILAFTALCINVFGQAKTYNLQVKISGNSNRDIIFIPGFAFSGNLWNETTPAL